ncbi:hypothetical protein BMETH_1516_1 [methanotrophic bacterial endosymbiont of Bathymodiolus sp.]|nr:hypothetical protein BMETH_1516_1 [methanotrophic bacterial endosymbiont of Bathymodiolus sp.]
MIRCNQISRNPVFGTRSNFFFILSITSDFFVVLSKRSIRWLRMAAQRGKCLGLCKAISATILINGIIELGCK